MKIQKTSRKFFTRKGFAMLVAIGGLTVTTLTGIALQTTTMEQVRDSGHNLLRARTRMGFGSALEHTRAILPEFARSEEQETSLRHGTEDFTYTVQLTRASASDFDPLATQLGAASEVFVADITVRTGEVETTLHRRRRHDQKTGAAVIDSATGNRILFVYEQR